MVLKTLGGLTLEGASFTRRKPLLLLTYLALEGAKGRRYLAELFWAGAPNPRNNLGTAIAQLRKAAPGVIGADRDRAWTTVSCDAQELLRAVEQGIFDRARTLYRGPFLEGVDVAVIGVELEEWIYGTREYLATSARRALLALAGETSRRGDYKEAAALGEEAYLVSGAPPSEPQDLDKIYTLLVAGRHPRALEVRQEAREYGLEMALTAEVARMELERTMSAQSSTPHNLAAEVSVFVGRHEETRKIETELSLNVCRLLTLVGAGGVGKTRLALWYAKSQVRRERYPDGVYSVPLGALTRPDQVPLHIANTLNFILQGRDEPLAQLQRHLAGKRMLLVLDNFEHLVEDAGLLAALVRACPDLTLLVTSRERLNLAEEWAYPITGLGVPAGGAVLEEAAEAESVKLFVERARQVDPRFALTLENFSAVVEICRLVEGLPLGIELAAAWVKVLTVEEVAREAKEDLAFLTSPSRNVEERHRSLRAVFESSWRRLTQAEQRVFGKLSVFRGGFTRAAAGEVAGATLPLLAALVDRSLLHRGDTGRYHLHELLRQFASDRLAADGAAEAKTLEAHARYYTAFLKSLEGDLAGSRQSAALDEIAAELGNIRAGWDWAVEHADAACLSMAAQSLFEFCDTRGQAREGADSFRRAIASLRERAAVTTGGEITPVLARLLTRRGMLADRLGELSGADAPLTLLSESEALLRPIRGRFPAEYSLVLMWRGIAHFYSGDLAQGIKDFAGSRESAIRAQDDNSLGRALLAPGRMLELNGEYLAAEPYLQKSIAVFGRVGERRYKSYAVNSLGRAAYGMGRYEQAEQLIKEALAVREDLNDAVGIIYSLADLGSLARMRGQYDLAGAQLQSALELSEKLDFITGTLRCLGDLGKLALSLGDLGQARRRHLSSLDVLRAAGNIPFGQPAALTGLAVVACLEGNLEQARQYLLESLELSGEVGMVGDKAYALRWLGNLLAVQHPPDPVGAKEHYRSALVIALRTGAAPLALDVLTDWAAIGEGDRDVAWLSLVRNEPRSEHETNERAANLLAERVRGKAASQFDVTAAAGRGLRLWELVEAVVSRRTALYGSGVRGER